jgi:hypothetical protein
MTHSAIGWIDDLRIALAPFDDVTLGRVVPRGNRFELVLTTRESPPDGDLVEQLWNALGELLRRADSPIYNDDLNDIPGSAWYFDPPLGPLESKVFEELDWNRAVVVRQSDS